MNTVTDKPAPAKFLIKELKAIDHDRQLLSAHFSPCGRYIFGGDYDGVVNRWDVESGARTALTGNAGWIQGLVFHPDARRMFTADSWGNVIAWHYADAEPKPLWKVSDCHAGWMRGLAIDPDGSMLATCGVDRFVRLWSAEDGSRKTELPRLADELFCLAFHPDGKSLVSGDLKGVAVHWDLATGKPTRELDARALYARPVVNGFKEINDVGGIRTMTFDSAGKTLACGGCVPATSGFFTGKPLLVLIDWETGKLAQSLQPPDATPQDGVVMAVSHDAARGVFIACCSGQPGKGALWCWRPGEEKPLYHDPKMSHLRSASLHPDGKRLAVTQVMIKSGTKGGGNGRKATSDEEYVGLVSKVRLYEVGT